MRFQSETERAGYIQGMNDALMQISHEGNKTVKPRQCRELLERLAKDLTKLKEESKVCKLEIR